METISSFTSWLDDITESCKKQHKEDILNRLKEAQEKEYEELKSILEGEYKMHLTEGINGELQVNIKDERIFYITEDGRCYFYWHSGSLKAYKDWCNSGRKCSQSSLEWKDKKYKIIEGELVVIYKSEGFGESIIDFDTMSTYPCKDTNIKRLPNNNKIIIY